ncbi:MAG TPA: NYN domain-containing protein [Candidatus Nanoarchaeia archaeon]
MLKNTFQRVGVFIDIQNLYYSAKNLYSAKVNFGKILETAVAGRQLIRAFAYVIRADIPEEQPFFDALTKSGFEVKAKDIQIFPGGVKKGDWDVGIVTDMIRLGPKLDVMILVSGDGDYVPALEYLRNQGHLIEVIAFGKSTSAKLITEADEFTDLDQEAQKYLIRTYRNQPRRAYHRNPNREKTNLEEL